MTTSVPLTSIAKSGARFIGLGVDYFSRFCFADAVAQATSGNSVAILENKVVEKIGPSTNDTKPEGNQSCRFNHEPIALPILELTQTSPQDKILGLGTVECHEIDDDEDGGEFKLKRKAWADEVYGLKKAKLDRIPLTNWG